MNRIKDTEPRPKSSSALLATGLFSILLVSTVAGIIFGAVDLSLADIGEIIRGKLAGTQIDSVPGYAVNIVWELRFPRALLAVAVGGGLAICGAAMQSITQNVLAEPYILGVSSGASAMVALAYYVRLGVSLFRVIPESSAVSMFAFAGAMLSLLLVYSIGMTGRSGSGNHLVLAGMAVSVILNAVTNFIIAMLPNESALKNVTMWMWGSLAGARWSNVTLPIVVSVAGLLFFSTFSNSYNLMSLGNETAVSLGTNVRQMKRITLFVLSLMTGIFVASCGLIGFIGFIIPHIVRMVAGADHRKLFPYSYLCGAAFLSSMDIISRTLLAPREMAVGIFSAFCGGPFFVFLLFRRTKRVKI